MREINLTFESFGNRVLPLGIKGENLALQVSIDCATVLTAHPTGHAALTVNPPEGEAYPGEIWMSGNTVLWQIRSRDLLEPGRGTAVLNIVDGLGTVLETVTATTVIQASVPTGILPEQIEDWLQSASVTLKETQQALLDIDTAIENAKQQSVDENVLLALERIENKKNASIAAFDSHADETAEDEIDGIQSEGATQIAAVEAKGQEVLESIPEEYTELSGDVTYLKSALDHNYSQTMGYLKDISEINLTFTEYNKDNESVTVEIGKRIPSATGIPESNSSYSYISLQVPDDGYFYCTASPTDSSVCVYSGLPIGADTYLYGKSKTSFPTAADPIRVYGGQVIAVTAKTTSASQLIYLSDNGTAFLPEGIEISNLKNGYYPITQKIPFTIGRWGADGTHTSTVCARNKETTVFDHDTVAICDLGYKFYNIIDYTDAWHQVKTDVCTYIFKANTQYRINITKLDETTITDANQVASHVMLYDVITSDYYKYQRTFFGLEMYNKIAIVGDSYSMKRSTYNNCWGQIIGQKLGIEVNLFGHSGYTTNTFRTAIGSNNSLAGLLSANANDLYWLGFGINDSAAAKQNPSYIGSVDDVSDGSYTEYPNTLWGNYGCIIESIKATFPSAKIILCNVMYHDMYTMQVIKDTTNIPLVNSALIDIAEHYQIPLIDLMDDIFYRSPEYGSNMQATAYTHPDPILFPGMANANMRLFAKAVADNPAYFKTSTADN